MKVRTFGDNGVSEWIDFTSSPWADPDALKPVVTAWTFPLGNYIGVSWDHAYPWDRLLTMYSNWEIHRTTVDVEPTDYTTRIAEVWGFWNYNDPGYNDPLYPLGAALDTTYYYWVRAIDKQGIPQVFSDSASAKLGKPEAAVEVNNGASGPQVGWYQNWRVRWTIPGGALGTVVRSKQSNLSDLFYVPITGLWVAFQKDKGQDAAGDYIQEFVFTGLTARWDYDFEFRASNNQWLAGLWAAPLVVSTPVKSGSNPLPPS